MFLFNHKKFNEKRLSSKMRIIELGCGRNKIPGAFGVDHQEYEGVDKVVDLNKNLPFEDESFDIVYSNQVLEHISNLIGLIEESHRILSRGGIFVAHVPYFRSSWASVDPTHVRSFTLSSLNYFVKNTYENQNYRFSNVGFSKIECYLDTNYKANIFRWFFTKIAMKWPNRFENSILSFIYPFQTLTFVLTK